MNCILSLYRMLTDRFLRLETKVPHQTYIVYSFACQVRKFNLHETACKRSTRYTEGGKEILHGDKRFIILMLQKRLFRKRGAEFVFARCSRKF